MCGGFHAYQTHWLCALEMDFWTDGYFALAFAFCENDGNIRILCDRQTHCGDLRKLLLCTCMYPSFFFALADQEKDSQMGSHFDRWNRFDIAVRMLMFCLLALVGEEFDDRMGTYLPEENRFALPPEVRYPS